MMKKKCCSGLLVDDDDFSARLSVCAFYNDVDAFAGFGELSAVDVVTGGGGGFAGFCRGVADGAVDGWGVLLLVFVFEQQLMYGDCLSSVVLV